MSSARFTVSEKKIRFSGHKKKPEGLGNSGATIKWCLGLDAEFPPANPAFCCLSPPVVVGHSSPHPSKIPDGFPPSGTLRRNNIHKSRNHRITIKMAPPKRAARPAQENISLGPQVREGELVFGGKFHHPAAIFAILADSFDL